MMHDICYSDIDIYIVVNTLWRVRGDAIEEFHYILACPCPITHLLIMSPYLVNPWSVRVSHSHTLECVYMSTSCDCITFRSTLSILYVSAANHIYTSRTLSIHRWISVYLRVFVSFLAGYILYASLRSSHIGSDGLR